MAKIKVTQTGSPIRRTDDQRATLKGLGLNKMHKSVELEDSPEVRGMIRAVPAYGVGREGKPPDSADPARQKRKRVHDMKLNEIRDNKGARKSRVRVGRGIGSGWARPPAAARRARRAAPASPSSASRAARCRSTCGSRSAASTTSSPRTMPR